MGQKACPTGALCPKEMLNSKLVRICYSLAAGRSMPSRTWQQARWRANCILGPNSLIGDTSPAEGARELTDAREQGGNMARKIGTTSRRIPKSKFDAQETHKCPRCNAFLVHERFYGMCAHIWVWRCIKCGEIIDDVVLYNRRLLKKAAKGIDIMTLIR